jgi:hypothetical protein
MRMAFEALLGGGRLCCIVLIPVALPRFIGGPNLLGVAVP